MTKYELHSLDNRAQSKSASRPGRVGQGQVANNSLSVVTPKCRSICTYPSNRTSSHAIQQHAIHPLSSNDGEAFAFDMWRPPAYQTRWMALQSRESEDGDYGELMGGSKGKSSHGSEGAVPFAMRFDQIRTRFRWVAQQDPGNAHGGVVGSHPISSFARCLRAQASMM